MKFNFLSNANTQQCFASDSITCLNIARFFGITLIFFVPIATPPVNILTGLCILFWLLSKLTKYNNSWQPMLHNQVSKAIGLFLLVCCLGVLYSSASTGHIVLVMHKMARLLLIPVFFDLYRQTQAWRKLALYVFILSTVLCMVLAIMQLQFQYFILPVAFYKVHCYTPFKDTIFSSMFNSFSCFVCLVLCLNSAGYSRKLLFAILALGFAYATLITGVGRTGQVVFFCLLGLLFFNTFKNFKSLMYFVLAFVCILSILLLHGNNGFMRRSVEAYAESVEYAASTATAPEAYSVGLRLEFFKNSLQLIKQHPILGYGTGSFRDEYAKNFGPVITTNPHNQYVFTTVELGLLGLVGLCCIVFTLWQFSYQLPQLERNLLQGLIVTIFVGSLANSWLNDFTSMYFLVAMAGVFMAAKANSHACLVDSNCDIFSLATSTPSKLKLEKTCNETKSP